MPVTIAAARYSLFVSLMLTGVRVRIATVCVYAYVSTCDPVYRVCPHTVDIRRRVRAPPCTCVSMIYASLLRRVRVYDPAQTTRCTSPHEYARSSRCSRVRELVTACTRYLCAISRLCPMDAGGTLRINLSVRELCTFARTSTDLRVVQGEAFIPLRSILFSLYARNLKSRRNLF